MFWIYVLARLVVLLAVLGWATRRRGSTKGTPNADLDGNIRRTRGRAEGGTATQSFVNGVDTGGSGGL